MFRKWILMGLLIGVTPLMAAEDTIELTFNVDGHTSVRIEHRHGALTVVGWDREEVSLKGLKRATGSYRKYLDELRVDISEMGDVIRVRTIRPELRGWGWNRGSLSLDYELYVPRYMDLKVEHAHGRTEIEGINGGLESESRHVSLKASDIGGNVWIDHAHGRTRLENIGGSLRVLSRHGRLEVERVAGEVEVEQAHGSVTVRHVSERLNIDVRHGRLTVLADAVHGPFKMTASHGSISLDVPMDAAVDFRADTRHGRISSDLPINIERDKSRYSVRDKLNQGGNLISLKTNHGNITIGSR